MSSSQETNAEEETSSLLRRGSRNSDRPAVTTEPRTRTHRRLGCAAILISYALERVTFNALASSLFLFLNSNPFRWVSYNAAFAVYGFNAFLYIYAVFAGLISDIWVSRFKMISISYLFYIVGMVLLTLLSWDQHLVANKDVWETNQSLIFLNRFCPGYNFSQDCDSDFKPFTNISVVDGWVQDKEACNINQCLLIILATFFLLAIGAGAIKVNIAPFGAEQVRHDGVTVTRSFFNWYYWSINIGSFIGLCGMTYIQQKYGYFWGYLIPGIIIVVSLVVFLFGRVFYISRPPIGSVVINVVKIVWQALRNRRRRFNHRRNHMLRHGCTQMSDCPASPTFLDVAKKKFGGSFHDHTVDDVKRFYWIVLIFISLIPYWCCYFQIMSTYLMQGLHMLIPAPQKKGKRRPWIPVAWLTLCDVIAVLIFLPLLDRIIYPMLKRRNIDIPKFFRMGLGMVFALFSVLVAGEVEAQRHIIVQHNNQVQSIGNVTYIAADMSVFWQIPQYTLIGLSEVMTSVAGLEFAYAEAPRSMQGTIMGLYLLSNGLGATASAIVMVITVYWFKEANIWNLNAMDDAVNKGNVCIFFFCLAIVQGLGIVLFLVIVYLYKRNLKRLDLVRQGPSSPGDRGGGSRRRGGRNVNRYSCTDSVNRT